MVIEDEVNNNRKSSDPNRNPHSPDNVDARFLQEQIARVFTIWQVTTTSATTTINPSLYTFILTSS